MRTNPSFPTGQGLRLNCRSITARRADAVEVRQLAPERCILEISDLPSTAG
jgi:hypothetical protein